MLDHRDAVGVLGEDAVTFVVVGLFYIEFFLTRPNDLPVHARLQSFEKKLGPLEPLGFCGLRKQLIPPYPV